MPNSSGAATPGWPRRAHHQHEVHEPVRGVAGLGQAVQADLVQRRQAFQQITQPARGTEVEDGVEAKDQGILKYVVSEVLMWEGPFEGKLPQPILDAWQVLVAKFEEVTTGLKLDIGYHDSENSGGGYDGSGGWSSVIGGCHQGLDSWYQRVTFRT